MTVDDLETEVRALSAEDQALLLSRLALPFSPEQRSSTWSGADDWIRIEDLEERHRSKPHIVFERSQIVDGDDTEESIDILAAIKANPAAIGHPFILFAIKRWVQMVSDYCYFPKIDKVASQRRDIAKRHLERVSEALIEGAKDRAIPKEIARFYLYKGLSPRGPMYGILFRVWEILSKGEISKMSTSKSKIAAIEKKLADDKWPEHDAIVKWPKHGATEVIDFLKSDKGKRCLSQRRSWTVMRSSYDAWRQCLDMNTQRRYRVELKKHEPTGLSLWSLGGPDFSISDIAIALSDWFSWPTIPLQKARRDV